MAIVSLCVNSDQGGQAKVESGISGNIEYISEIDLKLKYRNISFAHNLFLSSSTVVKMFTEHDSVTAMLCAKF